MYAYLLAARDELAGVIELFSKDILVKVYAIFNSHVPVGPES